MKQIIKYKRFGGEHLKIKHGEIIEELFAKFIKEGWKILTYSEESSENNKYMKYYCVCEKYNDII